MQRFIVDWEEAVMAALAPPTLQLQRDHTTRPYGGAWWPGGQGVSNELLDLISRWPAERPSVVSYAYIQDDWDRSESSVPIQYRTRTLILVLADRSTCRLLQIPTGTRAEVAEELMAEACDPLSSWRRMDFVSTFRPAKQPTVDASGVSS